MICLALGLTSPILTFLPTVANCTDAYAAVFPDTLQGTRQMYDEWAKTYDPELKEAGYNGPTNCIDNLEKWLQNDKKARIMDVACGTGLVGEEVKLSKRGCKHLIIDGVDLSKEILKLCEDKNIYNRLICDSVGTNKLTIDDGTYDAVVCVGGFVPGHIHQECFPELVRITKPGGLILITMRADYFETGEGFNEGRFEGAIQALVQQDIWEELARDPIEGYFGKYEGVTLVFRVLQK